MATASLGLWVLTLSLGSAAPLPGQDGSYKQEALQRIATLHEKFVALARVMPTDAYTWRPMEGARSVSEAYLHVAAMNYGLTQVFGAPPPASFNFRGFERSTTDRERIVEELGSSFEHFRRAIEALPANGAERKVKMFGREMTTRAAIWTALEHLSEHLGQSIAYARSNTVVPPWSAARD